MRLGSIIPRGGERVGGTRMFDVIGDDHIRLEVQSVVDAPKATHLRYRVVR